MRVVRAVPRLRKPAVYLDTSVPSAYFNSAQPHRQAETVRFWNRLDGYRPHISTLVAAELLGTPDEETRRALLDLVADMPKLRLTVEAHELASLYVDEQIVPVKYRDDAVHFALATVHEMDYLVSWNFEHMVNVRVQHALNLVNLKCGYRSLEIVPPPEL